MLPDLANYGDGCEIAPLSLAVVELENARGGTERSRKKQEEENHWRAEITGTKNALLFPLKKKNFELLAGAFLLPHPFLFFTTSQVPRAHSARTLTQSTPPEALHVAVTHHHKLI